MRGSITLPSYCSAENFKFIPLFSFPNQTYINYSIFTIFKSRSGWPLYILQLKMSWKAVAGEENKLAILEAMLVDTQRLTGVECRATSIFRHMFEVCKVTLCVKILKWQ